MKNSLYFVYNFKFYSRYSQLYKWKIAEIKYPNLKIDQAEKLYIVALHTRFGKRLL